MQLSEKQIEIMNTDGSLLVTGGPGSGKTTISILKAAQISEQHLQAEQKVLFLSFARASVSRVVEAIEYEQEIPAIQKRRISVETYHSFFWRILKSHGYLIGLPRCLNILTPPNEAIALSVIRSAFPARNLTDAQKAAKTVAEDEERLRLATQEGKICFSLFAFYVGTILHGSRRIRDLIATRYPVIILDEFQDTNAEQWNVMKALGNGCRLIALADPEQRIYDWIGANPERLNHFRAEFSSTEIDLSTDNYRSSGTEIALFGNDILKRKFCQTTYKGVSLTSFPPYASQAMARLVTITYEARKRLAEQQIKDWSLAVLVPTKKMTRIVSDNFRQPPAGMTEIPHHAVIDMEAAILGAEVIAFLLQPDFDNGHFEEFVDLLCHYFQGKGGNEPTKEALNTAAKIRKSYDDFISCQAENRTVRSNSIIVKIQDIYEQTRALKFIGDPDKDWRSMRRLLEGGSCPRLKEIAEEVKNIRILDRGTQLRQALSQDWRNNGAYSNALSITRQAYMQEHFSTNSKPETGVVVMNMHKAKGKQFDEVIIFEGWPRFRQRKIIANVDRIVRNNTIDGINDQARQNMRVSITRGKRNVTILTPQGDPCVLLLSQ